MERGRFIPNAANDRVVVWQHPAATAGAAKVGAERGALRVFCPFAALRGAVYALLGDGREAVQRGEAVHGLFGVDLVCCLLFVMRCSLVEVVMMFVGDAMIKLNEI